MNDTWLCRFPNKFSTMTDVAIVSGKSIAFGTFNEISSKVSATGLGQAVIKAEKKKRIYALKEVKRICKELRFTAGIEPPNHVIQTALKLTTRLQLPAEYRHV